MIHAYKMSYFFIVAALWSNCVKASEYKPLPVPSYHATHSKSFSLSSMMSRISLPKMPSIPSLNFGKWVEDVDFSIVQKHKVMFGAAGAVIFLSFLVKQLQKSDTWKESLRARCVDAEKSVNAYTNGCVEQCPLPVRLAITPIKILLQFLSNAIKRYVAMNQATIAGSVLVPVAGRMLDSVFICPIPLLNFMSIGGMASGVILTKGYFDSNFAKVDERFDDIEEQIKESDQKNMQQHGATQEKIGLVQQTIETVKESITNVFSQIKNLNTGVGQIKDQVDIVGEQVKDVSKELTGIKQEVGLLRREIDMHDQKTVTQYEDLKRQLAELQKSHAQALIFLRKKNEHDDKLMLEIQGVKDNQKKNHDDLLARFSTTATHLSGQINNIQDTLNERFALSDNALTYNDHKDMQIKLLQYEVSQLTTNNS